MFNIWVFIFTTFTEHCKNKYKTNKNQWDNKDALYFLLHNRQIWEIINRNEKGKKEEENEQQDKCDRVKDSEIVNYSHKYTSLDRQPKFISH